MRQVRRILIAVKDPTAGTSAAAVKGAQLAIALGAEVELFHALSDPLIVREDDSGARRPLALQASAVATARARLERAAGRIRRHGVEVHVHAAWDFPAHEAIVRRALGMRADLVVADAHGGPHRAPWLLTYADWELLRLAPCPVLLAKSARPWRRPAILAAVDPSHAHAKPARLDTQILEVAQLLRAALRGRLELLHAYEPPLFVGAGFEEAGVREGAALASGAGGEARRRLDALVATHRLGAVRRHVLQSSPARAIVAVATQSRAAIVLMGVVSRSALRRFFVGATAAAVIDELRADVLVVKPGGFVPDIGRRPRGASVITLRAPVS
ncbi:MAG: universal stress protein [Steroidobacteraceae bacterium]|jgi:universal stress protein E|nr:universal stress protein [Steroidobacteraceae bacterium]